MTLCAVVLWSFIVLFCHSGFFGLPVEASKNFRVSTNQQRNVRESGSSSDSFSMREYLESKKATHKEELRGKHKYPKRGGNLGRTVVHHPLDVSTPSQVSNQNDDHHLLPPVLDGTLEIDPPLGLKVTEDYEKPEPTACQLFKTTGFITEEQSLLCKDNFNGVMAALIGARLGLLECSYQFQFERWNCSVSSPRLTTLIEHDLIPFEEANAHRNSSQSLPTSDQLPEEESETPILPNKNIKVADLRLERQSKKRPKNPSRASKTQRKRQFRRSMNGFVQTDNDIVKYPASDQLDNFENEEVTNAWKAKKPAKERLNNRPRQGQTSRRSEGEQATKETAFIYAITSAGVAYAVTESCSAGNLTDCSCLAGPGTLSTATDNSRKPRYSEVSPRSEDDGWKWGGCSDNIEFGLRYAEKFTDAPEASKEEEPLRSDRRRELKSLVNLHNNEVGRKVLFSLMKMKCRCHGVSGSCGVRTCWRALPHFREVGDTLKKKYESSVEISPKLPTFDISTTFDSSRKVLPEVDGKNILLRREKRRRREPISDTELVYVEKSPNYCKKDLVKGITGTKGRVCKRGSDGPESCETLCCGRGYRVEVVKSMERCNCRFVWCCTVHCRTCEKIEKRYTCK